jgi:hypothetical protein
MNEMNVFCIALKKVMRKLRRLKYFEYEVLIPVTLKSSVFWDVMPCCLLVACSMLWP